MNKKIGLIIILLITATVGLYFLLYKSYTNNYKNPNTNNKITRIIIDSFIPLKSSEIGSFHSAIYRVNNAGDTIFFLTEDNTLYKVYNKKIISSHQLPNNSEFWYFSINNNDSVFFDKFKNKLISNNPKYNILFKDEVNAIIPSSDSVLLLNLKDKKNSNSYLATYNILKHQPKYLCNLVELLGFDAKTQGLNQLSDLLTEGIFVSNSKNIFFIFLRTGKYITYNTVTHQLNLKHTKDSFGFFPILKKQIPIQDKLIDYYTLESEAMLHFDATCNDSLLFILSNAAANKKSNHVDVYSANNGKYLYSIKTLFDDYGNAATCIRVLKNYLYIYYTNNKIYVKKINA
jgi:hypothetical protein